MRSKTRSIAAFMILAACSTYAAELLSVDFESETVGTQPTASYVSPTTAATTTNNFVTVVNSAVNTAGTGNGLELYDNDAVTGTRVGYDFSTGESAVRFDISMAQLLDTGAASKYYSICILANGALPTSGANRYAEVRVYDNGNIRYYSDGLYPSGTGKTDYMVVGTAATLTMYANDSDSVITNYQSGYNLAANSFDIWLDGAYWGTGALLTTLSSGTTNGLGRVAVASGSGDVLMDYVFDDISVSTLVEAPPAAYLLEEQYEGQAIGSKPAGASRIVPTTNSSSNYVAVVDSSENLAGTGNAVRMYKEDPTSQNALVYSFTTPASQVSALRVDLKLAPLVVDSGSTNACAFYIGLAQSGSTMSGNAQRYINCMVSDTGMIAFDSSIAAVGLTNAIPLLASNNTLTIIVNDYDSQTVDYTGLDGATHVLQTNSVAYWFNGSLITFSNGVEYTTMDLNDPTLGGTIGTTENNLGAFGILANTDNTGLDYVFDDLFITTNLLVNIDGYAAWLTLFPVLGSQTNYLDDFEPDGVNNLLEYALGGDPTSDDAASILPTYSMGVAGGTNWLNYVYHRRDNAAALGLTYSVLSGTDLTGGLATPTEELNPGAGDPGFEVVTNRISTDAASQGFMQLTVEVAE